MIAGGGPTGVPSCLKFQILGKKQHRSSLKLRQKPIFEKAPSNLVSIGRYLLTPDISDLLRNQSIGVENEIQLTDTINVQAANNMIDTVMLNCKHFDCGSIKGYVEAVKFVASDYKFD